MASKTAPSVLEVILAHKAQAIDTRTHAHQATYARLALVTKFSAQLASTVKVLERDLRSLKSAPKASSVKLVQMCLHLAVQMKFAQKDQPALLSVASKPKIASLALT